MFTLKVPKYITKGIMIRSGSINTTMALNAQVNYFGPPQFFPPELNSDKIAGVKLGFTF